MKTFKESWKLLVRFGQCKFKKILEYEILGVIFENFKKIS